MREFTTAIACSKSAAGTVAISRSSMRWGSTRQSEWSVPPESAHAVPSCAVVDEVMGKAVAAGAGVVKAAAGTQWGYFGYFSDPDGYLWKVASAS